MFFLFYEFVPCTNFCRSCFQHVCSMLRVHGDPHLTVLTPNHQLTRAFRDRSKSSSEKWSWTGTPPIVRNNHSCWSWYIIYIYISWSFLETSFVHFFFWKKKWVLGKSWDLGLSHPQTHSIKRGLYSPWHMARYQLDFSPAILGHFGLSLMEPDKPTSQPSANRLRLRCI